MTLFDGLQNVAESRVWLITTSGNAANDEGSANFLTNVGILLKIGFHLGDRHKVVKGFIGLCVDKGVFWHTAYLVSF